MSPSPQAQRVPNQLVSYFWSGDLIRSRSVSDVMLSSTLGIPAPPARLLADWQMDISQQLALEPGDVESLPLARARVRWPDYKICVQAVADWTRGLGLQDVLASSDIALMACRGARYHHDGEQYGSAAFCNLFLSEDKGLDLHFAFTGQRIPLVRGTVVVFDTCQPHAVIDRASSGFDAADFPAGRDCSLIFLTWELPLEHAAVAAALGIAFDLDTFASSPPDAEQVRLNGVPVSVCPASGQWTLEQAQA
ncbi:MAG: hypothetical protein V4772_14615 [Pseudomonadota bacterium]